MEVVDSLEPTIQEEEETDLLEINQDSGKKLDVALNLDDQSKKSKSVAAGKKEKPAPTKVNKKINPGAKSKAIFKKKTSSFAAQSDANNKTGKKTADIISEEQLQDNAASTAEEVVDIIVDPDIRLIEEYDASTADELAKWENLLDISDIIGRKDTRNTYIMACEVLGVIPVSTMIESLSSSEVKLAHYGIGARGAEALAKSLERNTSVAILDLENNWITSGGVSLCTTLANNRFITKLNLADNLLGRECAEALSEMIKYNSGLENINLKGNQLGDLGIEVISNGLSQNTTLKELDLSYNDVGDVGITALGACLAKNDNLANLNLSWNKIRTKGFIAFFNLIKDNSTLEDLNLERNGIGENTTAVNVFLSRTSLKSLNLASNRIGDVVIQSIAKGLESNSSITNLDISYNLFTDKGAAAFLKTVLNNNSLKKLNIQGLRLTKESISKIAELRSERSDLAILD